MNRTLLWLLVPVLAVVVWLVLLLTGGDTVSAPDSGAANNADKADATGGEVPTRAAANASAPPAAIEASRSEVRSAATADGASQPPLPEDAVWFEVRVVDADTKAPVAGAEVRWSTWQAGQRILALPERDRQPYIHDQELTAEHFGWSTLADSEGKARIAGNKDGATLFARSAGRYGIAQIGGVIDVPKDGWVLELERDLTLRVRVLDALGRPAVGTYVGIRMFDPDGKPVPQQGRIAPQPAQSPDAVVEFRHLQRWYRSGMSRQRDMAIASWWIAPQFPGADHPGVAFDADNPPAEPVELRLPATGRVAARLLHDGKPLVNRVSFSAYRGDANDRVEYQHERHYPDADGWTRIPFVAVGGSLVAVAWINSTHVVKAVAAPLAQDEEVRVELTTEEHFALRGQFVGADGVVLANTSVQAKFDFRIINGGVSVETDAQGRFDWLLPRGADETVNINSLVFSQRFGDGRPALTLTVPPREIRRGINDLGVLQLAPGALVVAGQLVFDPPQQSSRGWFEVEALNERRGRGGEERWQRDGKLVTSLRGDGSFEVRGETKAGRYRLAFPWGGHLPIAPVEFQLGARDLMIPVAIGHQLVAKLLISNNLPAHLLRGRLRPNFTPPTDYGERDRYQANAWPQREGEATLRWQGLPAGSYALELGAAGLPAPVLRIEDVVLPLPEAGDTRLDAIDLRGKLQAFELRVVPPPDTAAGGLSSEVLVFLQPQADEQLWQGLSLRGGKLSMPVPPGPLELMVVGDCQPQRVRLTAEQVAVGQYTIELRNWPKLELLLANLPVLPEGLVLQVSCNQVGQNRDQRRFSTPGMSGGLDPYLNWEGDTVTVLDGRAVVTVGDGLYRLGVHLATKDGKQQQALRTVLPAEVQGGENLPPVTLQLSSEEVRAAIEQISKNGK